MEKVSICLSDIPKERMGKGKNGKFYIDLIVAPKREVDQYGNDLGVYISQSKEEREGNSDRIYVGNGKTLKGTPKAQPREVNLDSLPDGDIDDLPF